MAENDAKHGGLVGVSYSGAGPLTEEKKERLSHWVLRQLKGQPMTMIVSPKDYERLRRELGEGGV